jgi:hypothetical protein
MEADRPPRISIPRPVSILDARVAVLSPVTRRFVCGLAAIPDGIAGWLAPMTARLRAR